MWKNRWLHCFSRTKVFIVPLPCDSTLWCKIFGVLLIITKKAWDRIMLAHRMRGKHIGIFLVTNLCRRTKLYNFFLSSQRQECSHKQVTMCRSQIYCQNRWIGSKAQGANNCGPSPLNVVVFRNTCTWEHRNRKKYPLTALPFSDKIIMWRKHINKIKKILTMTEK